MIWPGATGWYPCEQVRWHRAWAWSIANIFIQKPRSSLKKTNGFLIFANKNVCYVAGATGVQPKMMAISVSDRSCHFQFSCEH